METSSIITELKSFQEGLNTRLEAVEEQKDRITRIEQKYDRLEALVERADHAGGAGGRKTDTVSEVVRVLAETPEFKSLRQSGRGRLVAQVPCLLTETKAAITSGGLAPYAAEPGIVPGGRMVYGRVRRLLPSTAIATGSVFFVREKSFTSNAAPQVEAQLKAESMFEFEPANVDVRTIAHWSQVTRQALDDVDELNSHIRTSLTWGLEKVFEQQILLGDGMAKTSTA